VRFDQHTLVLLVRPPDAPELSEEEAEALQDAHLAFRADLRDQGYLVAGGPLLDPDDERLRSEARRAGNCARQKSAEADFRRAKTPEAAWVAFGARSAPDGGLTVRFAR